MALDTPSELPCGTLLEDLIMQVTEGTDPADRVHQAACRYCQSAIDAVRDAWQEFQAVARSAVAIPEGLADRIVQRIRMLSSVERDAVVLEAQLGETQIGFDVLSRLARRAALTVPGVALATVLGAEADPDPLDPGGVIVSIRLVAVYGPPLEPIAAAVREQVVAELDGRAGTRVSRVHVTVQDIVVED